MGRHRSRSRRAKITRTRRTGWRTLHATPYADNVSRNLPCRTDANGTVALITITRDSGYVDRRRTYAVILDGNKIADLHDGETRQCSVSPVEHELAVRIDWCGSKSLRFSVTEDDSAEFRVASNFRHWRALFSVWYTFFAWNSYLQLVRTL